MASQSGQGIKKTLSDHVNLMMVVKGIVVSYLITIPTFIIFAFILTYTDFPEKYISTVVIITTIISILTAGSTATRNVRNRGWLNGAIVGAVYMLVLYLSSSIVFSNFTIDRHVTVMTLIGLLTGAIGGIIGINFKRGSHSKTKR
ncbi:MAG: TIGR04086 family membrane protein [Clostridia bacterium]|nr:TIGR04086 family membrane protein [Clostridia bacterium]